MKSTGIVRKTDALGRIVIPKETRTALGIKDCDPLEIYVGDNKEIILKLHVTGCTFCDEADQKKLVEYQDKLVCSQCISNLKLM